MRCKFSLVIALMSCLSANSFGQVQVIDEPAVESKPVLPVVDMTIWPAAEPEPALRYKFWGESLRTSGDNAIVHILKAVVEYNEVPKSSDPNTNWDREHAKSSVKDYPSEAARTSLKPYTHVLEELHLASRAQRVDFDFNLYDSSKKNWYSTLRLSELNIVREFGRLLSRQARLAIVEKRYDDAIEALQSGFRLAEISPVIGGNTLISKLVGTSLHSSMLDEVRVFIQQPDAPNLYWALASLPDEIGDLRRALEVESLAIDKEMAPIMDLPNEPITTQAWQDRIADSISEVMSLQARPANFNSDSADTKLQSGMIVLVYGPGAKAYLIAHGEDASKVDQMSFAEAVVRATRHEALDLKSESFKWALLPQTGISDHVEVVYFLDRTPLSPAKFIAQTYLPAVWQARASGTRLLTKRNQLITVEALRAYLASSDSKLPSSLEKLSPLPAWRQILGNAAFEYEVKNDGSAQLQHKQGNPYNPDGAFHLTVGKSSKP